MSDAEDPSPEDTTVSARVLRPALKGMAGAGLDVPEILRRLDFDAEWLTDPDRRLSYRVAFAIWDEALAMDSDPHLPLRIAGQIEAADYDLLGLLTLSSSSAREAALNLRRFAPLLTDEVGWVFEEPSEGEGILRHVLADGSELSGSLVAYAIGSVVTAVRGVFGNGVELLSVRFRQPLSGEMKVWERFFRSPVEFDAPYNEVHFRTHDEVAPASQSPALHKALQQHGEKLLREMRPGDSFLHETRRLIQVGLASGEAHTEAIAHRLHVSPRGLRRKLQERDVRLSDLIEDVRRTLAVEYLKHSDIPVAEVSELLGYSEPSAFHRAFKKWTGRTPSEARSA